MSANHHTSERIYRSLKSDVLDGDLPVGPLNVNALIRKYGGSATPIREALLRLVGERQIILRPTGGFAIPDFSAQSINDLYVANLAVLLVAIANGDTNKLDREETAAVIALPALSPPIDRLFAAIAEKSRNTALIAIMADLNDHLRRIRRAEGQVFSDLVSEFEILQGLDELNDRRAMVIALRRYHRRRIASNHAIRTSMVILGHSR